jgi:hypothetical protein
MEVAPNGDQAVLFLQKETSNQKLKDAMKAVDTHLESTPLTLANLSDFTDMVKDFMNDIAEIVFSMPVTRVLPIYLRMQLNLVIFNAISTKSHFKLLVAYHQAYHDANVQAQQAMRLIPAAKDDDGIEVAVNYLKNILHMPTPYDAMRCVGKFFDAVVCSLPGNEIAADDILPAICMAMAQDPSFGSHVVSFFQYLVDLWPSTGMDEKLSYVLITCSIAATHLSHLKKEQLIKEKPPEPPVDDETDEMLAQRDDTIGMLENLLDMF